MNITTDLYFVGHGLQRGLTNGLQKGPANGFCSGQLLLTEFHTFMVLNLLVNIK
jgi:hypothetical protein